MLFANSAERRIFKVQFAKIILNYLGSTSMSVLMFCRVSFQAVASNGSCQDYKTLYAMCPLLMQF